MNIPSSKIKIVKKSHNEFLIYENGTDRVVSKAKNLWEAVLYCIDSHLSYEYYEEEA